MKIRQKECTAYGHTCKRCGKNNHFEHVCLASKRSTHKSASDEHEGAVFDSLSTVSCAASFPKITSLDHHLHNSLSDTWSRTNSKPQPFVDLTVSTSTDDYRDLGFNINIIKPRSAIVQCMADTGCQNCLAGMKTVSPLGITTDTLIPVTLKMHAANNKGIRILGAVVLRISGKDNDGNKVETRQVTYVTDSTDKFFLSRDACIELGMISTTFPSVGEMERSTDTLSSIHENHAESDSSLTSDCDCPRRETPHHYPHLCHSRLQQSTVRSSTISSWRRTV